MPRAIARCWRCAGVVSACAYAKGSMPSAAAVPMARMAGCTAAVMPAHAALSRALFAMRVRASATL